VPGVRFSQQGARAYPLGPILETIGSLTQRIREYDRKLETISREHYPETDLLRQVEGIGVLTALTLVLTL
jgi:transposase